MIYNARTNRKEIQNENPQNWRTEKLINYKKYLNSPNKEIKGLRRPPFCFTHIGETEYWRPLFEDKQKKNLKLNNSDHNNNGFITIWVYNTTEIQLMPIIASRKSKPSNYRAIKGRDFLHLVKSARNKSFFRCVVVCVCERERGVVYCCGKRRL